MRRARPEDTIQRAVFQHLKARAAPGVYAFAVPMGGKRKPIEAAIMKGLGSRAGIPDICIIRRGQSFFLELKALGGRVSDAQRDAREQLREAGAVVGLTYGLNAALEWLERNEILVGKAA